MSSFPAQAARVRDTGLPVRRRLLALRECVLRFAPYGFRAPWHHLVVSAGLPVWLESQDDPDSLLRAVDELAEARRIWLAEAREFAARRRREKAAAAASRRGLAGPAGLVGVLPGSRGAPAGTARHRGAAPDRRVPVWGFPGGRMSGLRGRTLVVAVPGLRGPAGESGGRRAARRRAALAADLASRGGWPARRNGPAPAGRSR